MEVNQSPAIDCKPNGPYQVKNLDVLRDSRGDRVPTEATIALCRCGGSAKKPFCDGTHWSIGFEDPPR